MFFLYIYLSWFFSRVTKRIFWKPPPPKKIVIFAAEITFWITFSAKVKTPAIWITFRTDHPHEIFRFLHSLPDETNGEDPQNFHIRIILLFYYTRYTVFKFMAVYRIPTKKHTGKTDFDNNNCVFLNPLFLWYYNQSINHQ